MTTENDHRRVALFVNPRRAGVEELAEEARRWWERSGYAVVVDRVGGAVVAALSEPLEFVVSFGGDGTMLRAVQATAGRGVPVLGVNLGNLGYLTQSEPETSIASFKRLVAGDYSIEWRMALSVVVRSGAALRSGAEAPSRSFLAINEATVAHVSPGHTIRVAVQIDGQPFLTYAADGVLVATPTGSTAYNLSARGPVVSPGLRALVLTAIAPHLLFDRSVVLAPEEWIGIVPLEDQGTVLLVDGTNVARLEVGDQVEVRAAPDDVPLVSFGERHFHAVLRAKFAVQDR